VLIALAGARLVINSGATGTPVLGAIPAPSVGLGAAADASRPPGAAGSPAPGRPGQGTGSAGPGSPSPRPAMLPPAASPPAAASSPVVAPAAGTGQDHTYTMTGGQVVLEITATKAVLVSVTPDAGFTQQTWHSPGWLRVDFNSGGEEVSSLIADWYQQEPAVTLGD
jgi:hypothetical protein